MNRLFLNKKLNTKKQKTHSKNKRRTRTNELRFENEQKTNPDLDMNKRTQIKQKKINEKKEQK